MNTWTTETADQKFSEMIRRRDPMCVRCKRRPSTDCSHFYERGNSATRYDPRNGDGVDRQCHDAWHANRKEYKEFKREQLGMTTYIELQRLAASTEKRDHAIARFRRSITHED